MSRGETTRQSKQPRVENEPVSNLGLQSPKELVNAWRQGWNRFWFTPSDPATLCLIRVFAGSMLFYTHLIWAKDLLGFFGSSGRLPAEYSQRFYGDTSFAWSHLYWIEGTPALLWTFHIVALCIFFAFAVGWQTRITGILAFVITVSYANRAAGALFGLDQINAFLALYLAIGPSGALYSVDAWLRDRKQQDTRRARGSKGSSLPTRLTGATLSVRLIQFHMCVVYLFAGLGKLQGETWWNGEAFWGALANAEYQSMDLTWMAAYPWLVNLATQISVGWEVSYSALIWPRMTRPIVLVLAIPLHMGIALGMGMMTFGIIMLVGNFAFVPPATTRAMLGLPSRLRSHGVANGRAGQGSASSA